ncbi:hypothetical protein L2750_01160 [Shewanella submarina]|uniref:Zinc ribbon domain-containing protein n=1 Tax=Shewanella submarina TaxID=2016376 RepID=A0ABV7GLX3_9GAMM|nr:hypothetical protein [Shewanella submarina]MCL1035769.1 hypothetical protein [Shewanella submarina]
MHHCGNALYLQDKFCTQCGEGIQETRKLLTLTDLEPELLTDLSQSCPDAKVFTGRLTRSFHYKRHNTGGNDSITYSYWWITLESAEGEIKQISINAENKAFNSLKVGDVITLLEPTSISLTYKLNSAAKGIVTNDQLAGGVILHNDDGQVSTMTNHYDCSKPSIVGTFFFGLLLAFIATAIVAGVSDLGDGSIVMGIFISIACMVPWYNASLNNFHKCHARKESIKAAIAKILEVSKYQLGFHRVERPSQDDDIFCADCESRIQANLGYCPHCGMSQSSPVNLLQAQTDDEAEFGTVSNMDADMSADTSVAMSATADTQLQVCETEPETQTPARKSIREMRLEKMKEFYVSHKQDFIYRYVLRTNEKFDGSAWCYMVQVTDRNMNTSVSDVTHTETIRTDYKNRYGNVVDSKYETHSYRVRDSRLNGKITVEDELGEVFEQWLPESLMSHTDVGDYLLIGYSRRERNDRYRRYGEYYYNISKGRWEMPESIHEYGETSMWAKFIVFLAAAGCGALAYYTRQWELPAGLFGVFITAVFVKSWLTDKANNANAHELIKPIMDTLYRVRDNKQEILAYLAKLK